MASATVSPGVYGVIAEFEHAEDLLAATKRAYSEGFRKMDAYSPFPVHGLADALGPEDHRIKWIIFFGGIAGACAGVGLEYWVSAIAYPHNVGGKPYWSWPLFVPVAYECLILFASIGAVFGMLALNGLPRPHHPIFGAKRFELASQDRFFLCIEATDPKFDAKEVAQFLQSTGASDVSEVLHDED
jgi:hypothetical protein